MKQAGHSRRPFSRSNDRHKIPAKQSHSHSGDHKVRGNPQQSVEKYLTLARDAASSGDPVSAENYYQYADHYYRLVLEHRPLRPPPPERRREEREPSSTPTQNDQEERESSPKPVPNGQEAPLS
jgi:hypothetical protein